MNTNSTNWVYWEKQGTDRLCGVHCINSLLQGPFYNEFSLADIARELDQQEKELMMEQGVDSKDYLTFMAEKSNNVADDGNYNIQVLSESLKRVGDLKVESIDSSAIKDQDLSAETGFICNSSEHWFPIRKINGKWYNLNSTNRQGPEMISDFYLSAFLHSVRENGYIIFMVSGDYPFYDRSFFGETAPHQKWFTEQQCIELNEKLMKSKNYKLNIGGTDERDLEKAIQNSLQQAGYDPDNYNEDDEYEKAIQSSMQEEDTGNKFGGQPEPPQDAFKAFTGAGISLSSNDQHHTLEEYFQKWEFADDPELAFALKLSLGEQYSNRIPDGPETINLNVRLFTGGVENWTFNKNSSIEEIYDFVKVKIPEDQLLTRFRIGTTYPKKYLTNIGDSIGSLGLDDQDMLVAEKI